MLNIPELWEILNQLTQPMPKHCQVPLCYMPHTQCNSKTGLLKASSSYLSFDMLQSMTVFLLVFTMIKGRWIAVLAAGEPWSFSTCLFLCTRFLKAICWNYIKKKLAWTPGPYFLTGIKFSLPTAILLL